MTKTSVIYGDIFETKNHFHDLRGWFYLNELCYYTETSIQSIYSWKSFKEGRAKMIGSYKFVDETCFPKRSFNKYKTASEKCTRLDDLYPMGAFLELMGVNSSFLCPSRNNHLKFEKVTFPFNSVTFIRIPNQVLHYLRNHSYSIRMVLHKSDEQWYDHIIEVDGIRYGILETSMRASGIQTFDIERKTVTSKMIY